MSNSSQAYLTTPYQVLDHAQGAPLPPMPDGHGGIAIDVWNPPAARYHGVAPIVGVDGEPAVHGFGRFLIVVPAGDHLVETQLVRPLRTMPVTVLAGQAVSVEYASPMDGVSPGALGTGPQTPTGRAFRGRDYILLLIGLWVLFVAGVSVARSAGMALHTAAVVVPVCTVAVGVAAGVALYRHQQRAGGRRR